MSQSKARVEAENRRLAAENTALIRQVIRLVELYNTAMPDDPDCLLPWPVEAGPRPTWWWAA